MLPSIESYPLPQTPQLPPNRVDWRLDTSRAALLVHDMQHYFVDAFGPESPLIATVVEHIAALRDAATAAGMPVFFTAQPPNQDPADRGLLWDFWGRGITDDGREAIVDELRPTSTDTVLTKWRYDAFTRSDLAEQLAQDGRDQLIITGVYAHIGCLTTATAAFMRDIQPFLVADALADFRLSDHLQALGYAAKRCAHVLDTATALDQLRDGVNR